MLPTKLLIFANPKAGTPVMLAASSSAIDPPELLTSQESKSWRRKRLSGKALIGTYQLLPTDWLW
jgi:uncharacterized protein (DUF302 family)